MKYAIKALFFLHHSTDASIHTMFDACSCDRFFQHLAMNMTNSYKTVYAAAAEVVGMSLQYLSDQERGEDDQKWRTAYIDNISKMLLSIQNTKPDILITCVHKMQLYHKAVADR